MTTNEHTTLSTLTDLGYSEQAVGILEAVLRQSTGTITCAGPALSGKSHMSPEHFTAG